jgi:hypothetical protein
MCRCVVVLTGDMAMSDDVAAIVDSLDVSRDGYGRQAQVV